MQTKITMLVLAASLLAGCATTPAAPTLDQLSDADLCRLSGHAHAAGDKARFAELYGEAARRDGQHATPTITKQQCGLYWRIGEAEVRNAD